MEYIDRIFYRKINPSDFKKLYDIDRPDGGGGQTYLEAAGISNEDIVDFLEFAEISDSPLKDETRSIYTFNTHVLGDSSKSAFLEFAPRGGRNNYRISRQNMKYKHPAWNLENGFPEPGKDEDGNYTSEGNFVGIIDNLVILILRTTHRKYYAGYINAEGMPTEWPHGIGLECIFEGERRGVINLAKYNLEFTDSLSCPFGSFISGSLVVGGNNILLYGVPGSGKSWTIEHEYCTEGTIVERLVFHPDYTNADFVGQILPIVDSEDKQVTYEFAPGPFTNILRAAYTHPHQKYVLVIEEINRGNAPAIFGDVFQLLDRCAEEKTVGGITYPVGTSEYGITNENVAKVVYGDPTHKVRIPANLSILGTMNNSDQNVFTLDTAFQRRWRMRLIENNFFNVRQSLAQAEILDTGVTWRRFCETINTIIIGNKAKMASAEDKRLGVYFVHESDLKFDDRAAAKPPHTSFASEYNELLKAEIMNGTPEEAARLAEVREGLMQIRIFPEKVIKYLWDDAFKFNPEALFDTDTMDDLEKVIRTFVLNTGKDRFKIFRQAVRDSLYPQS